MLFNLMGQCFQGIGLTKWTSVITKQCPNNADCMKANFDKCIKDYLETIARFPATNAIVMIAIKATNATAMVNDRTIDIKTIGTTIALDMTTRT